MGEPAIGDAEYDALEDEFRAVLADHPELTLADNPLEEVGAELAGEWRPSRAASAAASPRVGTPSLQRIAQT